ncbi:MAG: hypothetical protein ACK57R_04640 [Dolichospermum sp.]|jgi:hypothetical protein|nr:hypothetical protein [Anabaena sp. 49628_E55]OBQ32665.1 MAG: hypothetical protein AN487_21945 [Anabaena sp. CRKS33]
MTVKELIYAEIDKLPEDQLNEFYQLLKELKKNTRKSMLSFPDHDLDYLAGTWGEEDEAEFLADFLDQ